MEVLNEKDLITRIHQNDSAAENEFVSVYYSKIRMIVSMRINDREDQKELISDILIAAIEKIRSGNYDLNRESTLSKYVFGITRNLITQYLKDYYKKRDRDERLKNELLGNTLNVKTEKFEFEKREEIEQNKKIWRNLIEQLKPKYREIIYSRYYKNLSVAEISKEMNLTPQKVSDYLKYSKQLLIQKYLNK